MSIENAYLQIKNNISRASGLKEPPRSSLTVYKYLTGIQIRKNLGHWKTISCRTLTSHHSEFR